SERTTFAMRIGFAAAAAILVLAGASLNVSGRAGAEVIVVAIAGLMALVPGAAIPSWTIAGPTAAGSVLVVLPSGGFHLDHQRLPFQLGGLLVLAPGRVT